MACRDGFYIAIYVSFALNIAFICLSLDLFFQWILQ